MTEFFYTWPAVYVGYFFPRWMMPVFIAMTGAGYASPRRHGPVRQRADPLAADRGGGPGLTVAAHVIRRRWTGWCAASRRRPDRQADRDAQPARVRRAAGARARPCQPHREAALLIGDIDRFKTLNDRFGHAAGDAALAAIGRVLMSECRAIDTPARIGGEEFGVVLPGTDRAPRSPPPTACVRP